MNNGRRAYIVSLTAMGHSPAGTLTGLIVMTALASVPAPAHHGSGDEDWAIWDRQAFEVCGVVEKAEFVNPHLLVHVSFTTRNGALTWTFTAYAPNHAVRIGVTRQKFLEWFAPGTQVLAQGYSRVGGPNRARARTIIRTDGQALTDLSYDGRATAPPLAPRLRCMTAADTKANAPPRTLSFDEWKQKYSRAPVLK